MIQAKDCVLKFDYENMDFTRVTGMLKQAYWSKGIAIEEVKKAAYNSALVLGVFYWDMQIAYARVVSDKTKFAYIMDVYVDEPYRKNGIGSFMINTILKNEELKDVFHWVLITLDAHGVYKKCGFKALVKPEIWMEIRQERSKRR